MTTKNGDAVPEIVYDGTRYVLAYIAASGRDTVVVRFIDTNGSLLDDEVRIDVSEHAHGLALARGRNSVALGWITSEGVHAATIAGTMLAATPRLVALDAASSLAIAFNGSHYRFAWRGGAARGVGHDGRHARKRRDRGRRTAPRLLQLRHHIRRRMARGKNDLVYARRAIQARNISRVFVNIDREEVKPRRRAVP